MYTFRETFDSINQRNFDGQSALFLESAYAPFHLVEQAEKLVDLNNRDLTGDLELLDRAAGGSDAKGSENRHSIDLSSLRGGTQVVATDPAAYLVDMAKAEALDMMGEPEKATKLVDRHI